jgi:tRNA/rRNA methyltransferase
MSNFGFLRLRVVNSYDLAFREARSAVGAATLLAQAEEYKSLAEAVADCTLVVGTTAARDRELHHPLYPPAKGAALMRQRLVSGPAALVFGSEKRGLSNEDLSHCHFLLRIGTRDQHSSMNLGQAVAVCLYELVRDGSETVAAAGAEEASMEKVERITATLLEVLDASGYLPSGAGLRIEEKIRRLVRRLSVTADDAEVWLGILRQILWKIRSVEGPKS